MDPDSDCNLLVSELVIDICKLGEANSILCGRLDQISVVESRSFGDLELGSRSRFGKIVHHSV